MDYTNKELLAQRMKQLEKLDQEKSFIRKQLLVDIACIARCIELEEKYKSELAES